MARFRLSTRYATRLNTSDAQVYALVRRSDLPALKLGGRGQWRVERERFEEWLQAKHDETAAWVKENPLGGSGQEPVSDAADSEE